jgi:tetratricopeptide (TPR) repeat protein
MIIGLISVSVLPIAARAQAPAAPKPPAAKDQGEYDLGQAAMKETDPQKKLDLMHQWEQKYPDSDFKGQRAVQIASAESQIAAKALQPGASAADMAAAQKYADDLIDNLDKYLAPENKPEGATDAQWKQAKDTIILQAHLELGAVYASRKEDAKTEAEYRKILAIDPSNAATAYSLGILIYRQKKVERFPEAFFWIARGVGITGPEALPATTKIAADKYLKQAYDGYHGDDTGLDDLKKMASTNPNPPADLKIKSLIDIENEKAGDVAAFNLAHPDIALFRTVRDALKADGGQAYFETVKGSLIPPQEGAFKMFKGKVVSVSPSSPKELLVNVENAAGDVSLKFEKDLKSSAIDPGTEISFKGVIESFVKDPYTLTLTIDDPKEDVEGLPAAAFAAAPPPRRTGTKKKQ